MRLKSVSIAGFRSVASVEGFAIGRPTLIAGHNDAGKSAILDGVRFLLGDYAPTQRDLTFVAKEDPTCQARVRPVVQSKSAV